MKSQLANIKKVEKAAIQQQHNNNKIPGHRDDDSSSKKRFSVLTSNLPKLIKRRFETD